MAGIHCLSYYSIAVYVYHNQDNFYNRKYLIGEIGDMLIVLEGYSMINMSENREIWHWGNS